MFWQWVMARLMVHGMARQMPQSHGNGQYYGVPPPRLGPPLRIFFECPDCGWFHEEAMQIDCNFLPNKYSYVTMPCGGPTATEVHYLDGSVERVAKTD